MPSLPECTKRIFDHTGSVDAPRTTMEDLALFSDHPDKCRCTEEVTKAE